MHLNEGKFGKKTYFTLSKELPQYKKAFLIAKLSAKGSLSGYADKLPLQNPYDKILYKKSKIISVQINDNLVIYGKYSKNSFNFEIYHIGKRPNSFLEMKQISENGKVYVSSS